MNDRCEQLPLYIPETPLEASQISLRELGATALSSLVATGISVGIVTVAEQLSETVDVFVPWYAKVGAIVGPTAYNLIQKFRGSREIN